MLADGNVFYGKKFGKEGTTTGEICFNTGMTGYQEVFTDPSYYGQVLIMNSAHIGNYGINAGDVESKSVKIKGLICNRLEKKFSRYMAEGALDKYLEDNGIVAIHDVDTRALVAHIREKGAMNCLISTQTEDLESLKQQLAAAPDMNGLELASEVSTTEAYTRGDNFEKLRVAVYDFGVKDNILKNLTDRGAYLKVYPAKTSFEDIEKDFNPDGYFISNGPGDPAPMDYAVANVKKIIHAGKPVFGICLGHQLLALANGIGTFKMHHGHRGLNHPVRNMITGRSEITTQNHGFGVVPGDIEKNDQVEITHVNLNDGSIEGIRIKNKPAFSVQYHPEATPGPHDSRYLFDEFMDLVSKQNG